MRIVLLLLLLSSISFGQYSTYYVRSNENVKLDANVNVQKSITTIDYGALAQANAEREKTRLQAQMYSNEQEKIKVLEIAQNPLKAFDYGDDDYWVLDKFTARQCGLKKATFYHKIPHESLFVSTVGYNYRNESEEGVISEIKFNGFAYVPGVSDKDSTEKATKELILSYKGDAEKYIKDILEKYPVQEYDSTLNRYTQKMEINKATIGGQNGFVHTWVFEDDYEYVINDSYYLLTKDGWFVLYEATYKGDKDGVTFEMIEGRRYYFKRLVNQMFATAGLNSWKF